MIVETYVLDLGYFIKITLLSEMRFYPSSSTFLNFSMIYFSKKKFLLSIDCKSSKEVLRKDVKNLISKQNFARWQAILSSFDFGAEFVKGENNSLLDFLTREFL